MGLLRFLLALSVIVTHTEPVFGIKFTAGSTAVEAFFIISGFYMALVLNEKYFKAKNYYKLFISNRLLRLYPMYWVVILITIIISLMAGNITGHYGSLQIYLNYWHQGSMGTLFFLIITNIIILGQDLFFFLTFNGAGHLQYTNHVFTSNIVLYRFLLDLPLWTVSLEIMFYLISPLFVRLKIKSIVVIVSLFLIARLIAKLYGVTYDPFIYRFFPLQIVFFLMGILTYHVYGYLKNVHIANAISYICIIYISVFTTVYRNFPDSEVKDFIYLFSICCVLPVIFKFTGSNRIDRWIGELSYPMYISHTLLLLVVRGIMQHYHIAEVYFSLIVIITTICFSFVLISLIGKRLENYRAKRVKVQVKGIKTDTYHQPVSVINN